MALALPEDLEDAVLSRWRTVPELVQTQDTGWMGEFRDPFVWLEADTYFMLVGSGDKDNGGGNAVLYSSPDGIAWENHGFLLSYDYEHNQELGHVWELPVLLPLRDEAGTVVCHILLLCACQIEADVVETYYFLGSWNPEQKTFTKHHDKARLLDLGKGTFTGPSGFVTPDGRSVVFTIAQGKRQFWEEVHAGWAHNGGLPVELSIRAGQLHIQTIREVRSLEKHMHMDCRGGSTEEINHRLRRFPGEMLFLDYTARSHTASLILQWEEGSLEVYYEKPSGHFGVRDEQGTEIGQFRGIEDLVDIGTEPIHFSCYLDHSMLEVYLNSRKSITLRNYPQSSRTFQITGTPESVTLWVMDTAYPEESPAQ